MKTVKILPLFTFLLITLVSQVSFADWRLLQYGNDSWELAYWKGHDSDNFQGKIQNIWIFKKEDDAIIIRATMLRPDSESERKDLNFELEKTLKKENYFPEILKKPEAQHSNSPTWSLYSREKSDNKRADFILWALTQANSSKLKHQRIPVDLRKKILKLAHLDELTSEDEIQKQLVNEINSNFKAEIQNSIERARVELFRCNYNEATSEALKKLLGIEKILEEFEEFRL